MEQLSIRNFLGVDNACIVPKPITILIGPQASGKSLIAKLLFFCRERIRIIMLRSIRRGVSFEKFTSYVEQEFQKYFSAAYWEHESFSIVYEFNSYRIDIKKLRRNSKSIKIYFSSYTEEFYRNSQKLLNLAEEREGSPSDRVEIWYDILDNISENDSFFTKNENQIFIPSSRSFIVLFGEQIVSFLSARRLVAIDPFLREFAKSFESIKAYKLHEENYFGQEELFLDRKEKKFYEKALKCQREILKGDVIRHKNSMYLKEERKKYRTKLSDTSSGQQEAFPLLMTLTSSILLESRNIRYIIEEPEAHLFPTAQAAIVSLIGLIYRAKNQNFIVTTHSPYILSAFNNLIFAEEVSRKVGKTKISNILDPDTVIPFEDVIGYAVVNGNVEIINNYENSLIGESIIDSVSEEFGNTSEKLFDLL